MPQAKPHSDLTGRIFGLLTFFGGVALLGFVFDAAWKLFHEPVLGVKTGEPTAIGLGAALTGALVRVLILGILTWVASLVCSHGIRMYFAANGWSADGHTARVADRPAPAGKKPLTTTESADATLKIAE